MDPRKEFGHIIQEIIKDEVEKIDHQLRDDVLSIMIRRGLNPEGIAKDITFYYPLWLSLSFIHPGKEEIAKELVRFNLWLGIHILAQDDLIDRQASEECHYKDIIFSDYFLLKSMLRLGELVQCYSISPMGGLLSLYEDYMKCILWEKKNLKSPSHLYTKEDLDMLGDKFAPLMIDNVVFACMDGSDKSLLHLNSFLKYYHIYLQILDDMQDWDADLKMGNFTYFLTEIVRGFDMAGSVDEIAEFENIIIFSDITKKMAKKALQYLYLARSFIEDMDNPYLNEFLTEEEGRAKAIILGNERRTEALINEAKSALLKINIRHNF